jgi:hypothetical protein
MDLKPISIDAVPRALELVERYRLLNEPEQAASICHDVLAADPENVEALRALFLSITDQFGHRHGTQIEDAEKIAKRMDGDYEQAYYVGIAYERWARTKLQQNAHLSLVGDWLKRAMAKYEAAEAVRPSGNDDAILRWNACARLLARVPRLRDERDHAPELGD